MKACVACKARASRGSGLTFHKFPSNPARHKLWVAAVARENWTPTIHSRLCSKHFKPEDFDRYSFSKVRIKEGVVPSIFPPVQQLLQQGNSVIESGHRISPHSQTVPPGRKGKYGAPSPLRKRPPDDVGYLPFGITRHHPLLQPKSKQKTVPSIIERRPVAPTEVALPKITACFSVRKVVKDPSYTVSNSQPSKKTRGATSKPKHFEDPLKSETISSGENIEDAPESFPLVSVSGMKEEIECHPEISAIQFSNEVDGTDESDQEFGFLAEAISDSRYNDSHEITPSTSGLEMEEISLSETATDEVNFRNCSPLKPHLMRKQTCASTQTTVPLNTFLTESKLKKKIVEQRRKIKKLQRSMKTMKERMQSMTEMIFILKYKDEPGHHNQKFAHHDLRYTGIEAGLLEDISVLTEL